MKPSHKKQSKHHIPNVDVYRSIKNYLSSAGVYSPAFEAFVIIKSVFNKNFFDLTKSDINNNKLNIIQKILSQRKYGIPLQYILKRWEFWGLDFKVGEGVLIPRCETEILVETALAEIKNKKKPVIIDLCSGSGCIAIAIATERPDAQIIALEKSKKAFEYLLYNLNLNKTKNVTPILGDVLKPSSFEKQSNSKTMIFDLIVSNPPYVKTSELENLQKEVKFEPQMALDGGNDGLFFFKNIINIWKSKLKPGGTIAFEIGINQEKEILNIMKNNNFIDINLRQDLNGIYRILYGKTKS